MPITRPVNLQKPFADSGAKNTIPVASQIGIVNGAASYTDGFPPLTMTPIAAGGIPPAGQDFNGIFNALSAHTTFQNAGGKYRFDAALSTAIGGYPVGFVLQDDAGVNEYVNILAGNTTNFNSTPASIGVSWIPYAGQAATQSGANVIAVVGGTADAITLTLSPVPTALFAGPKWWRATAANATTTPTVNTAGLGVKTLVKGNNLPLAVGDIPGAGAWMCSQYDPTSGNEMLLNPATGVSVSAAFPGFRSKFINGTMAIDQRNAGAAQTFTAAAALAYCVDRWYGYCTGANVNGQRVAGSGVNQYRYQFTGAASVTGIGFGQRIEKANCMDLAGSTATLSVELANSLLTTVTWTAYYANTDDTFGTLASPTRTQIATGNITVNSTVTRYNVQIAIPGAATTGIEVVFSVGAQISGTWTIGNVQLESGSTVTAFERRPINYELAAAQRYFQRWGDVANAWQIQSYASAAAQNPACPFTFPVSMRVAPTSTLVGTPTYTNASIVTANTPTPYGGFLYLTSVGAGMTTAYCSGAGNYFKFEAEL